VRRERSAALPLTRRAARATLSLWERVMRRA